MTVIYAVWTYKPTKTPYMVIYDRMPFSARGRSSVPNNWKEFGRRQANKEEITELDGQGNRRFLTFCYSDPAKLIEDESLYGVIMNSETLDKMKFFVLKN